MKRVLSSIGLTLQIEGTEDALLYGWRARSQHIMKIFRYVIIVLLITCAFSSCNNDSSKLLGYDNAIVLPYISSGYYGSSIEDVLVYKPLQTEIPHPLRLAFIMLSLMKDSIDDGNDIYERAIRRYLDYLAAEYPQTRETDSSVLYQYLIEWNELEAGWWSGMANAAIAMAFLEGWRRYNEPAYLDAYRKALNGAVQPISNNGSTVMLDEDKCWFSEYAFDDLNVDNEYYVLNGFLVALLATKIAAENDPDPAHSNLYESKYKCGLKALKTLSEEYYYVGDEWTYYMLNPATNESVHYAIYDLLLHDALWKLTEDDFYKEHVERRRAILAKQYPLELCEHDNNKFLFSVIGPPYPYWIDTYSVNLRVYDVLGQLRNYYELTGVRDKGTPIRERGFLLEPTGYEHIARYSVSSVFGSEYEYLLYQGEIGDANVVDCSQSSYKPAFSFYCAYDAVCQGEKLERIVVDPSIMSDQDNPGSYVNSQGRIVIKLDSYIDHNQYKYLGFAMTPSGTIDQFRITVIDDAGNAASQYYVEPMAQQTNLIVVSWLGFDGIDNLTTSIAQIHITVFTSSWSTDEVVTLDWDELMLFENNYQLYEFMTNNEHYFPEQ